MQRRRGLRRNSRLCPSSQHYTGENKKNLQDRSSDLICHEKAVLAIAIAAVLQKVISLVPLKNYRTRNTNIMPALIRRHTPILVRNLILTFHNRMAGKAAQIRSVRKENTDALGQLKAYGDMLDRILDRLTSLRNNYLLHLVHRQAFSGESPVPCFTDWIALQYIQEEQRYMCSEQESDHSIENRSEPIELREA